MELTFKQEKETKNTVRYQEQSEGDVVIGPLYIQKSALGSNPPSELSLHIDLELAAVEEKLEEDEVEEFDDGPAEGEVETPLAPTEVEEVE